MVDYVNSQLENQGSESKITVNTQVVGNITRTTYQINGAGTEFDSTESTEKLLFASPILTVAPSAGETII